jgi:hypothetical protein
VGLLLALALFLGGDAAGGTELRLAVSATGVLGVSDTVVIAVTNPSSRVDVEIPAGYAFPAPKPSGGHASITVGEGAGSGRVVLSPLTSPPATDCAGGSHDQIWKYDFASGPVYVFLSGRVMTICPLPANTQAIAVASKYWSTPRTAGAYTWRATTAQGAQATTTTRLPVRLTLSQTARQPKVRLKARLTESGLPAANRAIQLVVNGKWIAQGRTNIRGTATFTLRLKRRTTAYVTTTLGDDAGERHTLQSSRLVVRPP